MSDIPKNGAEAFAQGYLDTENPFPEGAENMLWEAQWMMANAELFYAASYGEAAEEMKIKTGLAPSKEDA